MARHVEIIFVRHGDKGKNPELPDPEFLTEKGWDQARELGKKIGNKIKTGFVSSKRTRARDTARGIIQGMGLPANTKVHEWFTFDYNKPPRTHQFGEDFDAHHMKHGGTEAVNKWMRGEFDPKQGATPEQVGVLMAKPLRLAYKLSQGKGEPVRFVVVSHGGSNVESAFYALTGVNPARVGKTKGMFGLAEPFRLIMNGATMSVHFRGKRFKVQRAIMPVLKAPSRKHPVHEEVIKQLIERRKRLLEKEKQEKLFQLKHVSKKRKRRRH